MLHCFTLFNEVIAFRKSVTKSRARITKFCLPTCQNTFFPSSLSFFFFFSTFLLPDFIAWGVILRMVSDSFEVPVVGRWWRAWSDGGDVLAQILALQACTAASSRIWSASVAQPAVLEIAYCKWEESVLLRKKKKVVIKMLFMWA